MLICPSPQRKNNTQIPSQYYMRRKGIQEVFVQVWGGQHGIAVTQLMLLAQTP